MMVTEWVKENSCFFWSDTPYHRRDRSHDELLTDPCPAPLLTTPRSFPWQKIKERLSQRFSEAWVQKKLYASLKKITPLFFPALFFQRANSPQCQESHEASHCDVNRCHGNRPRWMTGRVPGGRDLSRTLAPADWLCRNVTGYALFWVFDRRLWYGPESHKGKKIPKNQSCFLLLDGWINKMDCYREARYEGWGYRTGNLYCRLLQWFRVFFAIVILRYPQDYSSPGEHFSSFSSSIFAIHSGRS